MRSKSPVTWLYLLAASLPFVTIPSAKVFGVNITASIILGAVFIFLTALNSPTFLAHKSLAVRSLYAFLGVCLISSLFSPEPMHGLMVTAFTIFVALLALAVAEVAPDINPPKLFIYIGLSTVLACLFGVFQFFGDLAGLPASITRLKPAYSGSVFGFPRLQSLSLEPLYFANFMLLPISLAIAFISSRRWYWLLCGLFTTAVLLTLSRGGIIALAIILIAWVILLSGRRLFREIGLTLGGVALGAATTAIILLLLVPLMRHKTTSSLQVKTSPTTQLTAPITTYATQATNLEVGAKSEDRKYTRDLAWKAFSEHPVLGIGPGNFGSYIHARNGAFPKSQIVNNEYMELLAETGAIGFVTMLGFVAILMFTSLKALWRRDFSKSLLGWAAWIFLIGVAVQYYSFSTLYILPIWFGVGLLLGVVTKQQRSAFSPILES